MTKNSSHKNHSTETSPNKTESNSDNQKSFLLSQECRKSLQAVLEINGKDYSFKGLRVCKLGIQLGPNSEKLVTSSYRKNPILEDG